MMISVLIVFVIVLKWFQCYKYANFNCISCWKLALLQNDFNLWIKCKFPVETPLFLLSNVNLFFGCIHIISNVTFIKNVNFVWIHHQYEPKKVNYVTTNTNIIYVLVLNCCSISGDKIQFILSRNALFWQEWYFGSELAQTVWWIWSSFVKF